ncbi:MAG: PLP-dependent aminotransferase family protein [Algicola sp.]|nr:PLP-dependent aminotransferase family protein [Algicola sp.]
MALYEDIAEYLINLIRQEHYCPGDKLPSIRKLARHKKVSVATVQRAFELLEDRRLIEPRAKSGFYVRMPVEPDIQTEQFKQQLIPLCPEQVKIHELASDIFHRCDRPGVLNLGTSYPAPYYYPVKQLQRISANVIKEQMDKVVEVHFSPGIDLLRKNLAKRLGEAGCQIKAEELIITNGCLEALSICLRAVAKPGDTIAIESPVFVGLLQLIESMGFKALEIPCHPTQGLSLPALELALEQWEIKAVAIVPTFSNPLGSNMPEQNRELLVNMLSDRNVPLIEDDLFVDLAFDGSTTKPCKAFDKKGLVLYCASASKAIASGFRVGWIAPGAFYQKVEYYKTFTNISAPNFAQIVMAEFLESGRYDRHLRQMRTLLAQQIYKFQQWIKAYFPPDVHFSHPQGACVLWVDLGKAINALEFHQLAVEQGIGIIPGQLFTTGHKYDHFIRINCACDPALPLEQAMQTLGALAKRLKD